MRVQFIFKFWFEWAAKTCFQSVNPAAQKKFGFGLVRPQLLPLSATTIEQIHFVSTWHDQSLNWGYPPDPGPWRQTECDRFNTTVKQLFERVIQELGHDYLLIYSQSELQEDPDLDEYLKDPISFKRG